MNGNHGRFIAAVILLLWSVDAFAQYSHISPSPDGTGIVYMGREIAQVMGHEGADWLSRPERIEEEQPDRAVDAMNIRPTDTVADIGAGAGYFSIRLARKATEGQVLAEDIQPEMIALMKENIRAAGVSNVTPILGTTDDPHLPPGSVDKTLLVDAYHEFDKPLEMMRGIVGGLKPDGEVIFIEYRAEDPSVPIKPHHEMSVAQLSAEMAAVGLRLIRRDESLPWQHMLIYGR
jgi:ubiquinone/menaquinone biosynthesis C-methylase UbiE